MQGSPSLHWPALQHSRQPCAAPQQFGVPPPQVLALEQFPAPLQASAVHALPSSQLDVLPGSEAQAPQADHSQVAPQLRLWIPQPASPAPPVPQLRVSMKGPQSAPPHAPQLPHVQLPAQVRDCDPQPQLPQPWLPVCPGVQIPSPPHAPQPPHVQSFRHVRD